MGCTESSANISHEKIGEENHVIMLIESLDAEVEMNPVKPKKILHIFHFNDVYNFEPAYEEEPIGGAARFCSYLQSLREKLGSEVKPLILFSGDFVGPSLMSSMTQGAHMIDVLNHVGVHYATFGNHEFDYGYESLKNRLAGVDTDVEDGEVGFIDYPETTSQWIMTNMTETATGLPVGGERTKRTVLVDWALTPDTSVKVGLLAVSENWLKSCNQLKKGDLSYEDYIESARAAAKQLKNDGAVLVICLGHNRLENDYKLAAAVPEIDLVLGGHDHFYKNDISARVVKSGEEWRWATYIKVGIDELSSPSFEVVTHEGETSDKAQHSLILIVVLDIVTTDNPLDPHIDTLCKKYDAIAAKKFERTIFETAVQFHPTEDYVRFKEGAVTNWICDVLCTTDSQREGDDDIPVDIVMVSGAIFAGKASVPAGPYQLANLMSMFPISYNLVVIQLSGENIVKSLAIGCQKLPHECGSLWHVSSRLKYTIQLSNDGNIVKDVLFDDEAIDLSKIYTVGISHLNAAGGFGYDWFKTAPRIIDEEHAPQFQDIITRYCRMYKTDPSRYPANPPMGRITILPRE